MISPDDPRIYRTPPQDFDHLTLADVYEHEGLEAAFRVRALSGAQMTRLRELRSKRHKPANIGGADARRNRRSV